MFMYLKIKSCDNAVLCLRITVVNLFTHIWTDNLCLFHNVIPLILLSDCVVF